MYLFVFTRIPVIDSRTNVRLSDKSPTHWITSLLSHHQWSSQWHENLYHLREFVLSHVAPVSESTLTQIIWHEHQELSFRRCYQDMDSEMYGKILVPCRFSCLITRVHVWACDLSSLKLLYGRPELMTSPSEQIHTESISKLVIQNPKQCPSNCVFTKKKRQEGSTGFDWSHTFPCFIKYSWDGVMSVNMTVRWNPSRINFININLCGVLLEDR